MEENNWAAAYHSWTVEQEQKKTHTEQVRDLYSSAHTTNKSGRQTECGYSILVKSKIYLHNFLWLTE
jgi:hypothetical protein